MTEEQVRTARKLANEVLERHMPDSGPGYDANWLARFVVQLIAERKLVIELHTSLGHSVECMREMATREGA
jgi:hypothetical protein